MLTRLIDRAFDLSHRCPGASQDLSSIAIAQHRCVWEVSVSHLSQQVFPHSDSHRPEHLEPRSLGEITHFEVIKPLTKWQINSPAIPQQIAVVVPSMSLS